MAGEVKERRKVLELARLVPRIGKAGVGIPEVIKEGLHHRVDGRQTLGGCVLQQLANQVDGGLVGLAEHLVERMGLDLRKLVLHVVRVHSSNLLAGGCPQHLDNFDELIDTRFTGEERLTKHQFCHDAAC